MRYIQRCYFYGLELSFSVLKQDHYVQGLRLAPSTRSNRTGIFTSQLPKLSDLVLEFRTMDQIRRSTNIEWHKTHLQTERFLVMKTNIGIMECMLCFERKHNDYNVDLLGYVLSTEILLLREGG